MKTGKTCQFYILYPVFHHPLHTLLFWTLGECVRVCAAGREFLAAEEAESREKRVPKDRTCV